MTNTTKERGLCCHDADACAMGQKACPSPGACGCEVSETLRLADWMDKAASCSGDVAVAAELRRLHARIAELQGQAVAEAARTAEATLRANQMTEQHRVQCNMRREMDALLTQKQRRIAELFLLSVENGARVLELEAQLSAIGAGGVESLRKRDALPSGDKCYSRDYGDTWHDCPDDILFVDGLAVGDEFELQVSVPSWPERFRVTKAPDDFCDDYEVEPVAVRAARPSRQCLQQSAEPVADVPFDDSLNSLGWKMDEFLRIGGAEYDGRVFNHMKSFLRECIQEWLKDHPAALQAAPPAPQGEKVYAAPDREALARELDLLANVQDERYPNFRAVIVDAAIQAPAPAAVAVPIELRGVKETVEQGGGFWRSCTGCHELNEGHATGPFSAVFGCALGNGCDECGGIGAVWDDADYDAMADAMAAAPAQEHATQLEGQGWDVKQRVFEDWLARTCPSGDADSVQRQWEESSDCADLHAAPIQAQEDARDPLQGAADWLVSALQGAEVGDLQRRLSIGHNRASRLLDAARAAQGGDKP